MLSVRECEAYLSGGSASLLLRESVPSLLPSLAVLHPTRRISTHTSKVLYCTAQRDKGSELESQSVFEV